MKYKVMKRIIGVLCLWWGCLSIGWGAEIWVAPGGNDRAAGTAEAPKATLAEALRTAREWRRLEKLQPAEGITIYLKGGVYPLWEPVFIRPEDAGTPDSPTVIQAVKGEVPVLSGGVQVKGWKKAGHISRLPNASRGKVWVADVPRFNGCFPEFRQLWVNGQKAVRVRNVVEFEEMYRIRSVDDSNQVLWVPRKAVEKLLSAPDAEMVLHEMWAVANLRIASIQLQGDSAAVRFHQPESRIQFEHPWPRPMLGKGVNSPFYLTNALELLDTPGEWYYDVATHQLYYYPRPGERMERAEVVIPVLENLVEVRGTWEDPVQHVRFQGISFCHTTWNRPSRQGHVPLQAGMYLIDAYRLNPKLVREDRNHKLDNQAWLGGRPMAAVTVRGANEVVFEGCRFEHLGACGLDFIEATRGGGATGCLFRDIAGNGIQVGQFADAAHETHRPYEPSDSRVVCTGQELLNNYITDVTNEDWGCVGICAGYVSHIRIEHNEISEVSYTGISLGWGWTQTVNCMRNNRVIANRIHHYAKHMYDVAGIYTLSAQPKTEIRENCISDIYKPSYVHDPNHWFYLYTDEGSSGIEVKDNWCEGEKFLQNANGPGNTWENNGTMVPEEIRERAGLQPEYRYLLKL